MRQLNQIVIKILLMFGLTSVSMPASAIPIKEIYVKVQLSNSATSACGLSKDSVSSMVETTVRSNGISVAPTLSLRHDYPTLSIWLQAALDTNDSRSCFGLVELQIGDFLYSAKPRYSTKNLTGVFEICNRVLAFSGAKGFEQQEKVNAAIADITRQCISEILKQ